MRDSPPLPMSVHVGSSSMPVPRRMGSTGIDSCTSNGGSESQPPAVSDSHQTQKNSIFIVLI